MPPASSTNEVDRPPAKKYWISIAEFIGVLIVPQIAAALVVLVVVVIYQTTTEGTVSFQDDYPIGVTLGAMLGVQSLGLMALYVVHRWGFGAVRRFGLQFRWIDIAYGFGWAVATFIMVASVRVVSSAVLRVEIEDSGNTDIVSDSIGSPGAMLLVFLVAVIGAPLVEEIMLRGLLLKALQGLFGSYLANKLVVNTCAIFLSSAFFGLLHFPDSSDLSGWLVLALSTGTLGAMFAVAAILAKRLGPAIIAHCLFNFVGVVAVLVS